MSRKNNEKNRFTKKSKLELVMEILSFCTTPQIRVRIISKSNCTDFSKLEEILDTTIQLGLLEKSYYEASYSSQELCHYIITNKGFKLVTKWKELLDELNGDLDKFAN